MNLQVSPGQQYLHDGLIVEVDLQESPTQVVVRDVAGGTTKRVDVRKLRPLPQKKAPAPMSIGYIPDDEWNRCKKLAAALQPFVDMVRVPHEEAVKLANDHGLSVRSIQRLRVKFSRNPSVSSLVRSSPGRRQGHCALATDVHAVTVAVIRKHYLKRERPSQSFIVDRVHSVCRRLKLPLPSPNAIKRRIQMLSGFEVATERHGRRAAKQKWEARGGKLAVKGALELVQIDHTRVDIMVVSEDRLIVLGRPWITLAIDVYTRCVLGFFLTMDAPNATSVSMCIEHMVLPKTEDPVHPCPWPMHGMPKKILVDNGKDLRAKGLLRGCEEHFIELEWRPVKTPHYGAHIERLNGTLMRLCHMLPGTTFSNPRHKGDYDSEKHATLTLDELRLWLTEKICRYYHVRRHRGINVAPLTLWKQCFSDAQGKAISPPTVVDQDAFRMTFLPFETRAVHNYGLLFRGSRYWHEDLSPLINTPDVVVTYDPRDPAHVWVRLPDERLVKVPAVAGRAVGDLVHRMQHDARIQAELDAAMDSHFERSDEIEAQAAAKTRQARRKTTPRPARDTPPPENAEPAPAAKCGTSAAAEEPSTRSEEKPLPRIEDFHDDTAPAPLKAPAISPFTVQLLPQGVRS